MRAQPVQQTSANQRLFPTFRGNGKTINDGDSQTSSLFPILESGASVHRLDETSRRIYETLLKYRFVGHMFLQEIIIAIRALGYSNAAK